VLPRIVGSAPSVVTAWAGRRLGAPFGLAEVDLSSTLWSDTVMKAGSAHAGTVRLRPLPRASLLCLMGLAVKRAAQSASQWTLHGLVCLSMGLPAVAAAAATPGANGNAAADPSVSVTPVSVTPVSVTPASATSASAASASVTPDPVGAIEPTYANSSNEALTALAARWDTLDVHERRALLTEVRRRMALQGASSPSGLLQIRTERRYGRIIRQPDGRLIRIETKVVHVRPVTEAEALASQRAGFGVGFEQRVGSTGATESTPISVQPASTAPAPAAPVEQR